MNKRKSLVDFIKLQRSVRTIDLDKTYESCFDLGDTFESIVSGKTDKIPTSLLIEEKASQLIDKTNLDT